MIRLIGEGLKRMAKTMVTKPMEAKIRLMTEYWETMVELYEVMIVIEGFCNGSGRCGFNLFFLIIFFYLIGM